MKRIERLGSVAFVTVVLSLVFHLLAMSTNHWKEVTCSGCDESENIFSSWSGGLLQRCYHASLGAIFNPVQSAVITSTDSSFTADVCIPNQYLLVKDINYAMECLQINLNDSDDVCALGGYNKDHCACDYSARTKLVLSMTILTAISLGVLIFSSHLIAFVTIDYVLYWLIPISYSILIFAISCMLVTLIAAGSNLGDDVKELIYSWSLLDIVYYNSSSVDAKRQELVNRIPETFSTTIGLSYGMEVLAFYFSIVSALLYIIMFVAKRRPQAFQTTQ